MYIGFLFSDQALHNQGALYFHRRIRRGLCCCGRLEGRHLEWQCADSNPETQERPSHMPNYSGIHCVPLQDG